MELRARAFGPQPGQSSTIATVMFAKGVQEHAVRLAQEMTTHLQGNMCENDLRI